MNQKNKITKNAIGWLFLITLVVNVVIHFYHDPQLEFVYLVIHLSAILGVSSLFFAILIPLSRKYISLTKPNTIMTLHHLFSFTAWTSILVHLLFLSIQHQNFTILLPIWTWKGIVIKGGPIAVIILILAALGLLLKKKNWKRFKLIHSLNIIAFIWICLHGIIKDAVPALGVNYPQLIVLSLMNLFVMVVLIAGAKVKKNK